MTTVRRVYLFIVAAAGLAVLAAGAATLGQAIALGIAGGGDRLLLTGVRHQVAEGSAAAVVGLPVWLLHWLPAQRAARRDAAERAALLRRLYLYIVLTISTIVTWLALEAWLKAGLQRLVAGEGGATAVQVALPLPVLLVGLAVWLFHRRVVADDRSVVGEAGDVALVRRLYRYGLALVTLVALLSTTALMVRFTWEMVVAPGMVLPGASTPMALASVTGAALAALPVWLILWLGWAVAPASQRGEVGEQDASSTLRTVYLFLALALSVIFTLAGVWEGVYFVLGRALGVPAPGGQQSSLLFSLGGPAGTLLACGASWLYQRRALAIQARQHGEQPPQAGVRRLYTYLVCLVALAVLAAGTGGLLWTVGDLATNAPHPADAATWWRDQVCFYIALVVVGLPVWLLHWRSSVGQGQRTAELGALSRRLYVYLALLAGVLVLLGSGVAAATQVLNLALGEVATSSAITNLARALSVAVVAALVVAFHQRVLRVDDLDSRARARSSRPLTAAAA